MNILLITSDQQHWTTLGCLNPEIRTPALDRMAAEGTLYERAYCPNPTCTPTRASIITGKYPSQHGAYSLGTKLMESEPTVGESFLKAGYRTALVGKAHFQPLRGTDEFPSLEAYPTLQDLDFWRQFDEAFYGFEHVELARNHTDEAHVGQHYALWMEEKGLTNWREHFRKPTGNRDPQQHRWSLPEEYHYNTWIAERSCTLLEQYQTTGENFFLWASFFDPHPSYLVPTPWDSMYDPAQLTVPALVPGEHDYNPPHFQMTQEETPDFSAWQEAGGNAMHGFGSHLHDRGTLAQDVAVYYGMVSCMDKYIGQIVAQVDALGLRDDTLIIFTSDHGHLFGQHGMIAKGPFHYEDLIRVPLIVSLPGRIEAGQRSASLQSLTDLAPTMLSACGIEVPDYMTGIDQKEVWFKKRGSVRDHVVVENRHQPTTIHARTYVDARYKITVYWNRDYGEVFDLRDDPGEVRNLWDENMTLRADLMLKLLHAEIAKEDKDYLKTVSSGEWEITVNRDQELLLFNLAQDPNRQQNLWESEVEKRVEMVRLLLFARMEQEPLPMPRIAPA